MPRAKVISSSKTGALLDQAVKEIRAIPAKLSGDDSPLADPWEETKEQVQHGLSFCWPAYLESMRAILEGAVSSLSAEDRARVAAELRAPPDDPGRLGEALLKRLLATAKREKIRYAPFDFKYFRHTICGMAVYARVLERTGRSTCTVEAYSCAAPDGETGEVDADVMDGTLSAEQFEEARRRDWPDTWTGIK